VEHADIMITELLEGARKMVGTPFLHQGRTGVGVDCIGFLSAAGLRSGIDIASLIGVTDSRSYGKEPSPDLLEIVQCKCEPLREPIPGAVLLFKMPKAKYPHHFALYTESGTIIHAEAMRTKRVVEQTYGSPWSKWLHSIWKVPGVRY
jgi:cell wall-associated NlpC family hydrolase